jgi:tetratricopeptide (TPR) repeat protein
MANINYAKGDLAKAKSDMRGAIAANPLRVTNYLTLGAWYAREGNWDEARVLWEKAHQVNPNSPEAAQQLAFVYLERGGDANLALSLAQAAKRNLPNPAPSDDILGWAYYKVGSADMAVAQLKLAVDKVPNNPIYLYHLGMAYLAAGKLDLADRTLRRSLQTPTFAYAADAKAALNKVAAQRN